MSPKVRKLHWLFVGSGSVVVLAGVVAARIASSALVTPLTLAVGESATVSVFRVLPDTVRVSLDFDRVDGSRRPELGEFWMIRGPNHMEFAVPGEPVVLRVQGPVSTAEYEALPAGARSALHIRRDLVVFVLASICRASGRSCGVLALDRTEDSED